MKTAIISYKNPGEGEGNKGDFFYLSLTGQLNPLDLSLSLPLKKFSFSYDFFFFKIDYFLLFSHKFT